MMLQFTWQGCDSLLAAPLVLDLVRFTELAHRRGERGLLTFLASFFKSPLGIERARLRPAVSDAGRLGRFRSELTQSHRGAETRRGK